MLTLQNTIPAGLTAPDDLLHRLLTLRQQVTDDACPLIRRWTQDIDPTRLHFRYSLENLAHYVALRRYDIRQLQDDLRPWGISSLGRIEAQVLPNLDAVIATLADLTNHPLRYDFPRPTQADFQCGSDHLNTETETIFGRAPAKRRVRTMVTLPSHAATSYDFVRDLLLGGMNIARINCAHDDAHAWAQMIDHLHRAIDETGLPCKIAMDLGGPKSRTADVTIPKKRLYRDDVVLLVKDTPVLSNDDTPTIRCTLTAALDQVQVGDAVWFDDGKIGAVVTGKISEGAVLRITQARPKGEKLKNDKGINFPDTALDLCPLTPKDIADLDFVVAHADMINYSFVQTPDDIAHLQAEIDRRHPERPISLIAKIETAKAVRHLPELIAKAGAQQAFGVMIARGDLAVELGFERLAEIQEEILWICEAAHVPVIWATQVLESLAKKGVASRAEVTDAAMSERAECVMLNKGDYILSALYSLTGILRRMEGHQSKKVSRLRALHSWENIER